MEWLLKKLSNFIGEWFEELTGELWWRSRNKVIELTAEEQAAGRRVMLKDWGEEMLQAAKNKGLWKEEQDFASVAAGIHGEVSEAFCAERKDLMDEHIPNRKGVEVELADAVIIILAYCAYAELDIGGAIIEKLEYNKTRPHGHGRK